MFTEIILNVQSIEKRMALLEDHQLVELFVEKEVHTNFVGNIYKGIVKDVIPGLGAAFVDIGQPRTGFLHYDDFVDNLDDEVDDVDFDERPAKKTNKSKKGDSKILEVLKPGDELLVQVQKGPFGTKGSRLIGQISIPGKVLVFFPYQEKIAISRRISSSVEKKRIKSILTNIKMPGTGIIVRTEAEHASEEDIVEEYNALYKSWLFLEKKIKYAVAPSCIFDENDIVSTIVRDIFSSKIDRLVVDDREFYQQITQRLSDYNAELSDRCELYVEDTPLFDAYNIEKEISKIFFSRIYLPSGGNIVIEPTEALVVIDVNTGSFTKSKNFHDTIKKTNMEAAKEIVRQIRLRNLSGIIIIDFIDMADDAGRKAVMEVLRAAFKRDRAKYKIYPFSQLGLVEISRKRTRSSLLQTYFEHCPDCHGTGRTLSREAVLFQINRWLLRSDFFIQNAELEIHVHPTVREYYKKNKKILAKTTNTINVVEDSTLRPDKFRIMLSGEKNEVTNKFNP
jgi:ribonuclease G